MNKAQKVLIEHLLSLLQEALELNIISNIATGAQMTAG
ncbi:hypothetical protein ABIC60_003330 [Phyllobacterium ifriqiyense]